MLLGYDVQAGVVIDRRGAYRGIVTVDEITTHLRGTGRGGTFEGAPAAGGEEPSA